MRFFGSPGRFWGVLGTLGSLWLSGPVLAQDHSLRVVPPHPHTDLHVGTVGDTLRESVEIRVLNPDGSAVVGAPVSLRALTPSGSRELEILSADAPTDLSGIARFSIVLGAPPGDYSLVASTPGAESGVVSVRVQRTKWFWYLVMGVGGGLALFLYGLRLIGRGLENAAGSRLREYLATMTSNRYKSFLFGTVSTLLVQSSSASTVLLVSFASAGLVSVSQCMGAVLGAAVGSTVTVQLIAFRLSDFALLLIAFGFLLTMGRRRTRRPGGVILGFGLLFFGLQVMSESMAPLRGLPQVTGFFVAAASDPIPALIGATLFTAIAQASAATIGIVLSLSFQGIVSLEAAIPFVLGANVGTAMTAILASLPTNVEGKRVAWAHAGFRLGGVLVILPFLEPFTAIVARLSDDLPRQIANAHTLLNVSTALLFLPFSRLAERVLDKVIPGAEVEPEEEYGPKSLDPRFHEQPSVALAGAVREVLRMGQLVIEMLDDVKSALKRDDKELAQSIRDRDDRVDILDEAVTDYLTQLSTEVLSKDQSSKVLEILFVTKDLELIADIISKGLVPGLLRKKRKLGLRFSDEGFRQILDFHDGVRESVELAVAAIATWDRDLASRVLSKKQDLSVQERMFHLDHLRRLREGNEQSRATTTVHVDAMNELKRILTHTARIAYAILGKVESFPDEVPEDDEEDSIDERE